MNVDIGSKYPERKAKADNIQLFVQLCIIAEIAMHSVNTWLPTNFKHKDKRKANENKNNSLKFLINNSPNWYKLN